MSQSLAKILVHVVFSTKNRLPLIPDPLRDEWCAYLAGTLRNLACPALSTNCVSDHVHVLCSLSKNLTLVKMIEELKKSSSKWLKTKTPSLSGFYWQAGYGAFSVSESNLDQVRDYIRQQRDHHRTVPFQTEFRAFLKTHHIEFDERYVWD